MIMISSPAGQRLVKAKAELNRMKTQSIHDMPDRGQAFSKALNDYFEAANALADELIEGNHHLVEGD